MQKTVNRLKGVFQNFENRLKAFSETEFFSNCTGTYSGSNPIYALTEKACGISDSHSIISRYVTAPVFTYLGLGHLYMKGRDISERIFKITEKGKKTHDTFVYGPLFNIAAISLVYGCSNAIKWLATGEMDSISETALWVGLTSPIRSYFSGWAGDVYRNLNGLKECNREFYPRYIKNASAKAKKRVMWAATAASLALTSLVYPFYPENWNFLEDKLMSGEGVVQVIENVEEVDPNRAPVFRGASLEGVVGEGGF